MTVHRAGKGRNRKLPLFLRWSEQIQRVLAPAFYADPPELASMVRAGLRNPQLALGYLELGARLNGEIGHRRAGKPTRASVVVVGPGAEAIVAWRTVAARIIQQEETVDLARLLRLGGERRDEQLEDADEGAAVHQGP